MQSSEMKGCDVDDKERGEDKLGVQSRCRIKIILHKASR